VSTDLWRLTSIILNSDAPTGEARACVAYLSKWIRRIVAASVSACDLVPALGLVECEAELIGDYSHAR
jgi:hypothetical protein